MAKLKIKGNRNTLGTYNIGSGFNDVVNCIVEEPYSGKTYVGGNFTTFNELSQRCLIRLNSDGSKDTSFDIGSGFDFDGGSPGGIFSVVVDIDGKIYVGGWFGRYSGVTVGYALIKLNVDGSIATEFDISGGFNNQVTDLVLNSDRKIYAVGSFKQFSSGYQYYLIRLNTDGTKDTGFNIGIAPWLGGFNENGNLNQIELDTNQKVFVCGIVSNYNGNGIYGLIKFNIDGTVDTSFVPDITDRPSAIKLDSNNNLYAGGDATVMFGPQQGYLVRLDTGGTIDTSFDGGIKYNASVNEIDIDIDGKILVGGTFTTFNGLTQEHLLRLNTDGTKDYSFNIGRGFYSDTGDGGIYCVSSISGKTYVGGIFNTYQGISQPYFIRLNSDGSNDMSRISNNLLGFVGDSGKVQALNFNNDVFVDLSTEVILSGLTEPISFYMYLDSNNYTSVATVIYSSQYTDTVTRNVLIIFLSGNYLTVQCGEGVLEAKKVDITNFSGQTIFVEIKRTDNSGTGADITYIKFNNVEQTLVNVDTFFGIFQEFNIGVVLNLNNMEYIFKLYDATIWNLRIPGRNYWKGYPGNLDSGWVDQIGTNNGSVSGTTKTTRTIIVPKYNRLELKTDYQLEASSLFSRMTLQPSNILKYLINQTIAGLKIDGVWELGDCLYVRGVHTSQAACLNWIKNAHNSTLVNSPIFIPKQGIKGDGVSSYINNNYNPYTQGVNFTTYEASLFFRSHTLGTTNGKFLLGATQTSPLRYTTVSYYTTGGAELIYLNNYLPTNTVNISSDDILGATKTGITPINVQGYLNGYATGDTLTTTSWAGVAPYDLIELGMNQNDTKYAQYNGDITFSWYGGYLNPTKVLALNTRIKYFYDNLKLSDNYDDDAYILFLRMTSEPTTALKSLINTTIVNLKAAGIWNRLDVLYMFNLHNSQAATLNWKSQINDCAIIGTGVTFRTKVGFKGDGTSSYLRLNYDPGTAGGYYQRYDCMHGFMAATMPTSDSVIYGLRRSDNYINVQYYISANEYVHLNETGVNGFYTGTLSGNTIYQFNRTSSTSGSWYINGGSKTDFTKTAVNYVPYTSTGWHALGWNDYNTPKYSNVELSNLFAGGSLTESENTSLYNILNYFNTNVGETF